MSYRQFDASMQESTPRCRTLMYHAPCMMHGRCRLSMQTSIRCTSCRCGRLTMHDVYHGQRTTSSMLVVDADPRCTSSMQNVNASCTVHDASSMHSITTTWRCRVRARGRRRCSRWCWLTILYNDVSTSRHRPTFISTRRRQMHEQYCTIRRMHEHCQHWHAATWCLAFILADLLAEVTWRARRQLPYFTELTCTAYIIQTAI